MSGCITSGEQWAFFALKAIQKVEVSEINLGTELENLPLVLGLLRDLVYRLALARIYFYFCKLNDFDFMQVENALICEE